MMNSHEFTPSLPFEWHDDACDICGTVEKRLCWDHDHEHGDNIRGRLCHRCNAYLGWFERYRGVILEYIAHPPRSGSYSEKVAQQRREWGRRKWREAHPVAQRRR